MDVVGFTLALVLYIWVALPLTGGDPLWKGAFIAAAITIPLVSLKRRGGGLASSGIRVDNLLPAAVVYLSAALVWTSLFLVWHRGVLGDVRADWPQPGRAAEMFVWALVQQFCLLPFILMRLKDMLGRGITAVLGTAVIFAFFHLPNPFLTLYTLGGGILVAALYLRWPNILAAAIAHATASALVARLLPKAITGAMKVGPSYW